MTKELRKAIMQRTTLRNIYLKQRTEATKVAYNQQRNTFVSILKKSKRSYFESLDVKFEICQTKLNQRKRSHLQKMMKSSQVI